MHNPSTIPLPDEEDVAGNLSYETRVKAARYDALMAGGVTDERAAFEAEIPNRGYSTVCDERTGGRDYSRPATRHAWEGWQARAALQAARAAEQDRKPLTKDRIDFILRDAFLAANGSVYSTRIYDFVREIEREHGIATSPTPPPTARAAERESLLRQALAALESCQQGAVEDGGRQWFDERLVDAAYEAIDTHLGTSANTKGAGAP